MPLLATLLPAVAGLLADFLANGFAGRFDTALTTGFLAGAALASFLGTAPLAVAVFATLTAALPASFLAGVLFALAATLLTTLAVGFFGAVLRLVLFFAVAMLPRLVHIVMVPVLVTALFAAVLHSDQQFIHTTNLLQITENLRDRFWAKQRHSAKFWPDNSPAHAEKYPAAIFAQ